MNTYMNKKYYEMHTEVLEICEAGGVRIIPGKRAASEVLKDSQINGMKEFYLVPEEMDTFGDKCVPELKNKGYAVIKTKTGFYRVYGKEMLATAISSIMKNPDGRHCPQFVVRPLEGESGQLEKTPYMGSFVYMQQDPMDHLKNVCGVEDPSEIPGNGYGIISPEITPEDFLEEARKRGYLTDERIARYNEQAAWRKENRTENEKKYREYQDVLLGLKQP